MIYEQYEHCNFVFIFFAGGGGVRNTYFMSLLTEKPIIKDGFKNHTLLVLVNKEHDY